MIAILYAWYGSIITPAYTSGTRLHGGSFDIANVDLLSPAYGATVSLPATFTWQRRGLAGDTYRIFLFDLDTGDGALTRDLGDTGSTTLTSLPDSGHKWAAVRLVRGGLQRRGRVRRRLLLPCNHVLELATIT